MGKLQVLVGITFAALVAPTLGAQGPAVAAAPDALLDKMTGNADKTGKRSSFAKVILARKK